MRRCLLKLNPILLIPSKSSADDILEYFDMILPEFDRDRVSVSDIRKVIKWFNFLNERDLLSLDEEQNTEEEAVEDVVEEEKTERSLKS